MADFYVFDLGRLEAGDIVEVDVESRQNVLLLNPSNYRRYQRDESFHYADGGEVLRSPVSLEVPHADHWYVVGDLGGAAGRISMDVRVIRRAA